MIKKLLFIVFAVFSIVQLPNRSFGQDDNKNKDVFLHPDRFYKKFFPHLRIKRNPPDSLYIKMYPNYLSVGMHVLSPIIGLDISSRSPKPSGVDPSSKFRTNIADVVGFSGSYRFVTVGFAFLLKSGVNTHDDYATSHYRTATVKYNSAALALQFKYLRVQGFTDVNQSGTPNPPFPFRQRPDLLSKDFQFEGVYNFSWRKYSYIGPLTFSQRQIKSRAGFLLKAGVYYNRLSGDSAIVGHRQQQYYSDFQVKAIQSISLKIAPGFGANLILHKHVYFAIAAFTSFDAYFYKYERSDEEQNGLRSLVFALDGKASLGYQSKRLYAGIRFEAESRTAQLQAINFNTLYSYTGIELGFRFDAPPFVKKVYKKTMPPGL